MFKKMLSLLLACATVASLITVPAYAQNEGKEQNVAVISEAESLAEWEATKESLADNIVELEPVEIEDFQTAANRTEIEPNDRESIADRIYDGDIYTGSAGRIDIDVFKFTLSSRSEIMIVALAAYDDLIMGVWDNYGDCIGADYIDYYESEYRKYSGLLTGELSAGTYYIKILNYEQASPTSYGISFTILGSSSVTAPTITSHPTSVTCDAPTSSNAYVDFSVGASGSSLSYQWQYRTSSSGSWSNCYESGYSTSELSVQVSQTKNGYQYRCKVSNSAGTVYSNAATLNVRAATSGSCGTNATWRINSNTLTIAGTGAMTDYSGASSVPWSDYSSSITSVVINSGITSIGDCAFDALSNLNSVTIHEGVTEIGLYSFRGCESLSEITLPETLETIGNGAFRNSGLTSIAIPQNVESIGNYAFASCYDLNSVIFDNCNPTFGDYVFDYCDYVDCWYPSSWDSGKLLDYGGVDINWYKLPSVITQPVDQYAGSGKVTFSVEASGKDLTYQWQWSGNDGVTWADTTLTGYNTPNLTVTASASVDGRMYRCKITSHGDMSSASVYSEPARLNLVEKITITTQPVDQKGLNGNKVNFTVAAEGVGLTYQWQYSINGTTWANTTLTGYNTPTLTVSVSATTNGRQYRCVITDTYGQKFYSAPAKLIRMAALSITSQPADQKASSGSVKFTVAAKGDGLKYQWQYSTDGVKWANTALNGYNTPTLTVGVSATTNGRKYRCVITDQYGQQITSDAATLIRTAALSISSQPVDQKASSGYVYFSATAKGTGLTYQWQWSADGENWANTSLQGATSNMLRVPASAANNGRQYRCVITDQYGQKLYSNPATFTLLEPLSAPVLTEAFNSSTGVRVSWKAVEGATYYRLLRKTVNASTGASGAWVNVGETTELTMIDKTAKSASRYTFTVECVDSDGNIISERNETGRTCTYIAMAKITSVTSVDEGLEVVWQKPAGAKNFRVMRKVDGSSKWEILGDVLGTRYLDTNVEPGVKYWYTVRAVTLAGDMYINSYNSYGWSGRWEGTPLTIITQPADQEVETGQKAYFSVEVSGKGLAYQWQWKSASGTTWANTSLTGYNTSTLSVTASNAVNGRQYRCVITDQYGNAVVSKAATLILR